jgi:protein O-GlcNAc transferase
MSVPQLLFHAQGLARQGRGQEALALFDQALSQAPDMAEAWFHRGNLLTAMGRHEEAAASYTKVLARLPGHVNSLNNRAVALQRLGRFTEAARDFEAVLANAPQHRQALGGLANCTLHACDWSRREEWIRRLHAAVRIDSADVTPGLLLGYSDDPALLLAAARHLIRRRFPAAPEPLWRGTPFTRDRIRLAYCSADFNAHATARLIAELIERHDRDRFEIIAIDFSAEDGSDIRNRLVKAFDQFHRLRRESDSVIAKRIADLGVDIAVDLKGFTTEARTGIFALRPAPIQVNYLGFPGSMGANFMDYILADPVVLPLTEQPFYAETILHLPDCYQPTDSTRPCLPPPARVEAGLPIEGFVFCCFNNNWKITPPLFDIWMRLLKAVPASVLWLLEDNREASANLSREAVSRGVEADRIIFAPRATMSAHLARHQLADLFLDTLPYNAHTTASDCLWAGVPLVTCRGSAFHGRVAASLLHAIGLDELVTDNFADYEALALGLAQNPDRLAALREKLAQNRATRPLFDTDRFARAIETAYLTMREAWRTKSR